MKKIHRTILFFSFTGLFALASILIISYSQGYRIDFKNKKITLTGGLFIGTTEAGARILLDGEFKKQTDFLLKRVLVSNLLPGEYKVRLEKIGFTPWEKKLRIDSELVTEARNILLVTEDLQREEIATGTMPEFTISPDGKRIAHITEFGRIEIIDLKDLLLRQTFSIDRDSTYKILDWADNPDRILLRKTQGNKNSLLILSLPGGGLTPIPLLPSLQNAHWYTTEKIIVEYLSLSQGEKTLALVHAPSGAIEKILLEDYAAYYFRDDLITFVEKGSRTLWRYNIGNSSLIQISPHAFRQSSDEIPYTIKKAGQHIAVREGGSLYLTTDGGVFEKIQENVRDFHFSSSAKTLLFWTSNELWVLFLEDVHIQPFRNKGDAILITRFGESIREAIWYSEDNEHIIFKVGSAIKITELDGRNKRNTVDLATSDSVTASLFYNTRDERLYFRNSEGIQRMKIR